MHNKKNNDEFLLKMKKEFSQQYNNKLFFSNTNMKSNIKKII